MSNWQPPPQPDPSWMNVMPSSEEERSLALLSHLGGILTSFLVPLIIWRKHRFRSPFVCGHSQEALNFQLTMLIPLVITVLCVVFIRIDEVIVLPPAVLTVNIVYAILAARAATQSLAYRYPLCMHFI